MVTLCFETSPFLNAVGQLYLHVIIHIIILEMD